ncbi:di-heme-cytochrome C peroxidase [Pseudomonas sp. KSR10]|uniref:di-heme-cytochrome C peroxidase n=1 Tax=Pseudomonas sp. KSR10 TaxID=2916654 RepID=UPI001EF8A6E8|nr:di-heme-cytochrome C peroxidase [Pseudomonas sp. KSR10]MCG6538944.1 di-heme-cytochrome C peroxidase [Pseudomonas sp. KSR10]
MRLVRRVLLAVLLLAALVVGAGLYFVAYPNLPDYEAPKVLRYLDQWSEADRQTYYYTPQGTQVKGLEYDWFGALELPLSRAKLAAPDYLARFGFLIDPTQKATALNPGNLPVGFARHEDDETGRAYLDVSCAACHTGELRYNGQAIRIDGGAAMHSLASTVPTLRGGSFGQALGMSMAFTYYNPLKFRRFAHEVLGENYERDRSQLRRDFKQVLNRLLGTAYNDWHRGLYPTEEGFGRTDAFGRIANTTFGDAIDPVNYRVANAPVSYPQLWDIWKFDWVQWNGSAMQPMARNIGEALGVGARLQLLHEDGQPVPEAERYASGVRVRDLHRLETTLMQLTPPRWPEEVLGQVDLQQASQGRALYWENCAHCHDAKPKPADKRLAPSREPEWRMPVVATSFVGTDPTTADNIADHRFDLTRLGWKQEELNRLDVRLFGKSAGELDLRKVSSAKGLAYITAYVSDRAYRDAGITPEERAEFDGFGLPIGVQEVRGYKARPLDGIWATPPFLHNGSVPTLFQLLSPVAERQKTFWTGSREYDLRHVGIRTERFEGGFLLDTSITGNSNRGHEFRAGCRGNGVIGRALEPHERWALVEYLKVYGDPRFEPLLSDIPPRRYNPGPACR